MNASVAALLYHHVGPIREPACRGLTVTAEAFRKQMGALAAMGYSTITPSDWARYVAGKDGCPERCFMLTFDDAYADLIANAFPVLEKHGFSATVFVPTSLAGATIACSPSKPDAFLPIMSRNEIVEWAGKGIEFGAHSRTHSDLSKLSPSDAEEEITGSANDLSSWLGTRITAFAYPYGHSSDNVRDVVSKSFAAAFGIDEGLNDASTPLWNLRRTMVQHGDSVVDVCLRARFGKSIVAKVRSAASGQRSRSAK